MIEQISVTDLRSLMAEAAPVIIDVREQWEFDSGHLPGAKWIPMALVPGRTKEFTADSPVFVVCRSGNRSGQVVQWLAHQGIRAVNVAGGTADWQSRGYPIETPTPAVTAERTLLS